MPELSHTRAQLATELRTARRLAGIRQGDLADKIGVHQTHISRIENGTRLLDRKAVAKWLRAVNASVSVRSRVLALTEVAHTETRTWADLLSSDRHLQGEAHASNASAALVQAFSPSFLPGPLQTADYARLVIALTDPDELTDRDAALAARIASQGLLREPGRRFDFVITERLLRWEPAPGVLAPQLAQLAATSRLDTVNLVVLPDDYVGDTPMHNFVIREPADGSPPYVNVELQHGEAIVTDEESVAIYRRLWARLWDASVPVLDLI